ncbi:hypothetical protein KKB41_03490 [Patescibacteria group bacterium]|nr:hypothetical protein [Patescibacteria group bacterium]
MNQLIQVSSLPNRGYIIEMPYDEKVGAPVFVSVIPYTQFDIDFIERYKNGITLVKTRMPGEDDFNFKMRLEAIIDKLRQWKQNRN